MNFKYPIKASGNLIAQYGDLYDLFAFPETPAGKEEKEEDKNHRSPAEPECRSHRDSLEKSFWPRSRSEVVLGSLS